MRYLLILSFVLMTGCSTITKTVNGNAGYPVDYPNYIDHGNYIEFKNKVPNSIHYIYWQSDYIVYQAPTVNSSIKFVGKNTNLFYSTSESKKIYNVYDCGGTQAGNNLYYPMCGEIERNSIIKVDVDGVRVFELDLSTL